MMSKLNVSNFQYDKAGDKYISKIKMDKLFIKIYISDYKIKDIRILNQRLNSGINWLQDNYEKIQDYCVNNLIEDVELENDEEITETEFKNRLELESIRIEPDGQLEIMFKDGDLFGGHWLVVDTDSEYNLLDVNIEG